MPSHHYSFCEAQLSQMRFTNAMIAFRNNNKRRVCLNALLLFVVIANCCLLLSVDCNDNNNRANVNNANNNNGDTIIPLNSNKQTTTTAASTLKSLTLNNNNNDNDNNSDDGDDIDDGDNDDDDDDGDDNDSDNTNSSTNSNGANSNANNLDANNDLLKSEFQRLDGWYNNLANADWGTPNSRLRRKVPPAYADGVYQMVDDDSLPSARALSEKLMRGDDGQGSRRNLTVLFAFFGQLVSSEILMASESGCPIEMQRIKISKCDPMYDRECRGNRRMPFYRAAYDPSTGQSPNLPREQINRVTSWIDGSFIYSTSETWLNAMRAFDGRGRLKMSSLLFDAAMRQAQATTAPTTTTLDSLIGYPVRNKLRAPLTNHIPAHHLKVKPADRMFLLGDSRTNQNPLLLTLAILFYRWHNVLADRIHQQHPNWSDEDKFQRARRLVIASLQNIVLYEYLPTLLDTPAPHSPRSAFFVRSKQSSNTTLNSNRQQQQQQQQQIADLEDSVTPYAGYKPDLHPGVSHVFQSAAFRFGHTLIPPGLYARNDKCEYLRTPSGYSGIRLCSTWWNAEEVVSKLGVEPLLMGAASQIAEREDFVLCNDIRDKLFGPMDFSRRDLAALNIMRGRDNGLADYNTVRRAFKLKRATRWRDINPLLAASKPGIFNDLSTLYGNELNSVDLYIGGMLESDSERGRPGPLFRRIIKEQFERLRDADRFWFENTESGLFSAREIQEIRNIKLYDIIVNATLIPDDAIQRDVFRFKARDPCPQPAQLSSSQLQPCYSVRSQSYFKGNELTYALVIVALILVPIVCVLISFVVLNKQNAIRRRCKSNQEYARLKQASLQQLQATNLKLAPTAASSAEKFYAKEWLHANLKRRIKVKFGPALESNVYVLDRSGEVLRQVSLRDERACVIEFSALTNGNFYANSTAYSNLMQRSTATVTSSASLVDNTPTANKNNSSSAVKFNEQRKFAELLAEEELLANDASVKQLSINELAMRRPLALLRAPNNYDLVLQFNDLATRRRFVYKLYAHLQSLGKSVELRRVARDVMLANAETKERRQQRLEHFFREAYALTFGFGGNGGNSNSNASSNKQQQQHSTHHGKHRNDSPPADQMNGGSGESKVNSRVSPDIGLVMRTSLSRAEFADSLGMRADSLFVKQMFNCIDKDRNGRISFQEFLDTVVAFSRGKTDDKLRIVFDMCNHNGAGVIEKVELERMLSSLIDIAKTRTLTESGVNKMIDEMFKAVGLQDKQLLTYEDFKLIVGSRPMTSSQFELGSQTTNSNEQGGGNNVVHDNNVFAVGLDMKGAKKNFFLDTQSTSPTTTTINDLSGVDYFSTQQQQHASNDTHRRMTLVDSSAASTIAANVNATIGNNINKQQQGTLKRCFKRTRDKWREIITELEQHRQDIVYLLVFFTTVFVLFAERFINYSFLSEHMDLRHVMGVGIAITRGSAASLSFCYAMLLLSMCRNIMTRIRVTPLREYIPLDSHVKFHKIVAITALVMTVLHTAGHCVNFFHVTQQPVEHLRCLTKEMQFSAETRPTFFYWIFQTVTGFTGLLLWILCSIVYVFARAAIRNNAYSVFWSTHKLYYLIYALSLLHGSSKLTGSPRFWLFFIGPAIIFTIDKIISLQTKLLQLEIIETECLPSNVTSVRFARPPSFKFLSGQWVRVACTAFRQHEFHAFTLTSAPQDDFLSIHVRAQGPWTWKLRSMFEPANVKFRNSALVELQKLQSTQLKQTTTTLPALPPEPRIRIEGPFGGGNQDWYKYEVAVMICGGIGVTPYASILNDLMFGATTNRYAASSPRKVYFIWICPSHRNFEWFIDVLRDVESKDSSNVLEMHIFITQFFHKFDLRTTMLYICEKHFQRISNRSLFTGLKAINHFGRPDVAAILQYVQKRHSCVSKVGVFSCGPKAMTKSITHACENVNKKRKLPFFLHQYENFS